MQSLIFFKKNLETIGLLTVLIFLQYPSETLVSFVIAVPLALLFFMLRWLVNKIAPAIQIPCPNCGEDYLHIKNPSRPSVYTCSSGKKCPDVIIE